jgi:hypothetical protein
MRRPASPDGSASDFLDVQAVERFIIYLVPCAALGKDCPGEARGHLLSADRTLAEALARNPAASEVTGIAQMPFTRGSISSSPQTRGGRTSTCRQLVSEAPNVGGGLPLCETPADTARTSGWSFERSRPSFRPFLRFQHDAAGAVRLTRLPAEAGDSDVTSEADDDELAPGQGKVCPPLRGLGRVVMVMAHVSMTSTSHSPAGRVISRTLGRARPEYPTRWSELVPTRWSRIAVPRQVKVTGDRLASSTWASGDNSGKEEPANLSADCPTSRPRRATTRGLRRHW